MFCGLRPACSRQRASSVCAMKRVCRTIPASCIVMLHLLFRNPKTHVIQLTAFMVTVGSTLHVDIHNTYSEDMCSPSHNHQITSTATKQLTVYALSTPLPFPHQGVKMTKCWFEKQGKDRDVACLIHSN